MKRVNDGRVARTGTCLAIFAALLSSVNGALAAEATREPPPGKPDAIALSGGGFALDFKVWKHPEHGEPKGLSVTYEWGEAGPRLARAQRRNDHWHVEFPDQPQPNEQASLKLRYTFALSGEDKTLVRRAAARLEAAILRTINQAADKAAKASPPAAAPASATAPAAAPGAASAEPAGDTTATPAAAGDTPESTAAAFNAAFTEAARALSTSADADTLRSYGTSSGQDGLSFVLEQLGIKVGAGGAWTLDPESRDKLVKVAKLQRRRDTSELLAESTIDETKKTNDEQSCVLPDGKPTQDEVTVVLRACAKTLDELAKKAKSASVNATSELLAAAQATPLDLNLVNYRLTGIKDESLRGSYSYAAVQEATSRLRSFATEAEVAAHDTVLLKGIDDAFENGSRVEDGATLIEGRAQPRRYDVATGAVFVSGIQDIVVPSLISICLAAGCLKANEVAWKGKWSALRALSIDAGIRVKTLDTQDRHQSDKLSFLTGLSYNPVSVLRVSGGFYWFENAQRKNWTGQLYVGITFNVLNAAEILGALGLGDQMAPTTNEVK